MEDSTYAIFLAFGLFWVVMGGAAVVAMMRADGQPIRLDKWGLVVVIPIVIPLIIAFTFAFFALYR